MKAEEETPRVCRAKQRKTDGKGKDKELKGELTTATGEVAVSADQTREGGKVQREKRKSERRDLKSSGGGLSRLTRDTEQSQRVAVANESTL